MVIKYKNGDTVWFKHLTPNSGKLQFVCGEIDGIEISKENKVSYNVKFYSTELNDNYETIFSEEALYSSFQHICASTKQEIRNIEIDMELDKNEFC